MVKFDKNGKPRTPAYVGTFSVRNVLVICLEVESS